MSDIDDISINYEDENGVLKVKEIKKEILTRGSWTTIMFVYQDFLASKDEFGPEKITIRRYRKINDRYVQQSKFNISGAEQGKKIADIIYKWTG